MKLLVLFLLLPLFYQQINFCSASLDESLYFTVEREDSVEKFANFTPDWDSLDARKLPKWYDEAKVGIFIHWGVYAVPSFGSEWFWQNWKGTNDSNYINFMERNFKPGFSYQDFGADFTAELFDPDEWAEIFQASGAKYVVLTSKHHEGYALWPSAYSYSWNSVEVGPHRDIVGDLKAAIEATGELRFGVYHSLYEWFNPMYLKDKSNEFRTQEFVKSKIIPEMVELIERYKPEVLWSDGEWEATDDYWQSKEFLAWLFNESPVAENVVTNDRWGNDTLCQHGDFYTCRDRYNPGILEPHKWENAMTIDKKSWGHRAEAKYADFYTAPELIAELVTTVSCRGNILINVGPTKEGTIEAIFVDRLMEMGKWLKINGEAIYKTIPWKYQNDTLTPGVWYTRSSQSISLRYNVYATVLNYPYDDNSVILSCLADYIDSITEISLLGYPDKIEWSQNEDRNVTIVFPPKNLIDKHGLKHAWSFKVTVSRL